MTYAIVAYVLSGLIWAAYLMLLAVRIGRTRRGR